MTRPNRKSLSNPSEAAQEKRDLILKTVVRAEKAGRAITITELSSRVGGSKDSVRQHVEFLIQQGLLCREGDSPRVYVLRSVKS